MVILNTKDGYRSFFSSHHIELFKIRETNKDYWDLRMMAGGCLYSYKIIPLKNYNDFIMQDILSPVDKILELWEWQDNA